MAGGVRGRGFGSGGCSDGWWVVMGMYEMVGRPLHHTLRMESQ